MIKNLIRGLVFGLVIVMSSMALASPNVNAAGTNGCDKNKDFFGIPVWYKYLGTDGDTNCNVNTNQKNVPALVILGFIDIALYLAGILAVLMIIWGGYKFILSDGSPDQIAGGRKTILNAVIGLLIAIFSAQIVRFVASKLSGN
jgi:hypothetical protein